MAPKPRKTGGKASPYDYTDGPAEIDLPALGPEPIERAGKALTPESVANMVLLVSTGVTVDVAAVATGAGNKYKHWAVNARKHLAEGREPGFEYEQSADLYWLEEMNRAKALFEAECVRLIYAAAPVDWKAAQFLLERRASSRWHLQSKLEITAKAGEKIEISAMSTDKLMAIARGLLPEEAIRVTKSLGDGREAEGEIISPEEKT